MKNKPFVLLDRDGTIIVNKHYQKDPDDTELLSNAKEGLHRLRDAGFGLVLLTNQSGIARGLLTRADVDAVNARMIDLLGGGEDFFAGVYCCPHGPGDNCACRKPLPGLARRAADELGVSLREAYAVGDREIDVAMGHAAGAKTLLVRTGYGAKVEAENACSPDFVADDLLDAARWIIGQAKKDPRAV